jgi:Ras-related protein Rab-32
MLSFRDVVGQARFGTLTRHYYRGALGGFVAFDVMRDTSYSNVPTWKADVDNVPLSPLR